LALAEFRQKWNDLGPSACGRLAHAAYGDSAPVLAASAIVSQRPHGLPLPQRHTWKRKLTRGRDVRFWMRSLSICHAQKLPSISMRAHYYETDTARQRTAPVDTSS